MVSRSSGKKEIEDFQGAVCCKGEERKAVVAGGGSNRLSREALKILMGECL